MDVPVIDVSPWVDFAPGGRNRDESDPELAGVADAVDRACREVGCFCVVGHGLRPTMLDELDAASRRFFALPAEEKASIGMDRGGRAWRGWFPLGGELTGGVPDHKEGIYFGRELPSSDPRVEAGMPLHGPNLFPARPEALRPLVIEALTSLESLGQTLLAATGSALGVGHGFFSRRFTSEPVILMRVFHYPAVEGQDPVTGPEAWGVGEHTDYGLLTLLHQDCSGGLEVRTSDGWVEVNPPPGALVCTLGDMLAHLSNARYRATPHRVKVPDRDRISIPFFIDPSWDVPLADLRLTPSSSSAPQRQPDTPNPGTYGDYLVSKVARVFPGLRDETGITRT